MSDHCEVKVKAKMKLLPALVCSYRKAPRGPLGLMSPILLTYLNNFLLVNCRIAISPDVRHPQLIPDLVVVSGIQGLKC
jgi:hypothetical protein